MKNKSTVQTLTLLLALLMLCFCFASCSKAENSIGKDGMEIAPGNPGESIQDSAGGLGNSETIVDTSTAESAERKIIKTYDMTTETTDFDAAISSLNALVSKYGGYIQNATTSDQSMNRNSKTYTRYASFVIRVPAEQADAFVGEVGTQFHITRNNAYVEDISETYYSVAARLEELEIERDSLLDILNATDTKKDYDLWLTVSQRLSEVRQQIAVYQAQIRLYDNQVAYSIVDLAINEVINYTAISESNSFGSRLGTAFKDGWNGFVEGLQDFTIGLAEALPTLILLALIGTGIGFLVHKILKTKKLKKQAKESKEVKDTQ